MKYLLKWRGYYYRDGPNTHWQVSPLGATRFELPSMAWLRAMEIDRREEEVEVVPVNEEA